MFDKSTTLLLYIKAPKARIGLPDWDKVSLQLIQSI